MRTDVNRIEIGQRYEHPQRGYATVKAVESDSYTSILVEYDDKKYEPENWFVGHFLMKFRGPDELDIFMKKVKNHRRKKRNAHCNRK